LGEAIVDGNASSSEILPMLASEIAPGGIINVEPLNTPFPIDDLATLMMGISDNTATDLLHQRVGRTTMFLLFYSVISSFFSRNKKS
jgi:beta-lactamase class A